MDINIMAVYERDIDLFFIDEFISDKDFAKILLDKVGIDQYNILKVYHSKSDINLGESDITFIIEDNKKRRYGILIEDKIDALAMEKQCERYFKRGNKGVKENKYDDFFIFIIAPKNYLNNNVEAQKYPYKVSYEELLSFLEKQNNDNLIFKIFLFKEALKKKINGYEVTEDSEVTKFWQDYYQYQERNFPQLFLNKSNVPKGTNALWPMFNTDYSQIKIYHKSNTGAIDLTFPDYGSKMTIFRDLFKDKLEKEMIIVKTSKSAAIRIKVNIIDFHQDFMLYEKDIEEAMSAVERLNKFINNNDIYHKLYEE